MINYHRVYCGLCGFDTIAHRGRCFAGHKVSAYETNIKEVKHQRKRIKPESFSAGTGEGRGTLFPQGIE